MEKSRMGGWLERVGAAQTALELMEGNRLLNRYGLQLSREGALRIAQGRVRALRDTGRVEFGAGVAAKLLEAFCDSPYLTQDNLEETVLELQDSFYYFKGEAMERLDDDELIGLMHRFFHGAAQGSLEYLSGCALEELCREIREDSPDAGRLF